MTRKPRKKKSSLNITLYLLLIIAGLSGWILYEKMGDSKIEVYNTIKSQSKRFLPFEGVTWEVPVDWVSQPVSGFTKAHFFVPTMTDKNIQVTVVSLNGKAGGLTANVNRWRRQLNLEPLTEPGALSIVDEHAIKGREFLLVDLTNQKSAIVVAMTEYKGKTWFFKLTGDAKLVNDRKLEYMSFLSNVRFK